MLSYMIYQPDILAVAVVKNDCDVTAGQADKVVAVEGDNPAAAHLVGAKLGTEHTWEWCNVSIS